MPVARGVSPPVAGERAPRAFASRWLDLVLAGGVEFCMVFWAADFLRSVKDIGSGVAIGVAPLALGTLADLTALRAAVFVAPALLPTLLLRCGWRLPKSAASSR